MTDLKEIASYALKALKDAGADDAQCVVARGRTRELTVDGGEISLIRTLLENQVSFKAIKDGKKGTITINQFGKEQINQAAHDCIEAANAGVVDDAVCIAQLTENKDFVTGAQKEDADGLFDRVKEYLQQVKTDYPKIILEQVIAEYSESDSILINSNGVCQRVKHGGYYFNSMFSAHEGENATSFNYCDTQFNDLSRPLLNIGMQRELLLRSQMELEAKRLPEKFTGKILVAPICLLDLIGMALGNFISDTSLIDGTSPWKNRLGSKVADEKLTISMSPLDERMAGGERITNDGYISENYDIIKNGVLVDFGLSEYAAKKTGNKRGPNSSGCMVIAPGKTALADLIRSIDKGLLVYRFSGGQPAINGDFSGVAKNSFYIENGEIKHAVTETMISGNLSSMINQVVALSSETVEDGASSLPYALFDGITVSC